MLSSAGSFIWLGYCYKWFWGCGLNNFILIETTVMVFWFYIASLLRVCNINLRENYNIFVCSVFTPYLVYLCWASLASLLGLEECNQLMHNRGNTTLQIVAGVIISALAVLSIAIAS